MGVRTTRNGNRLLFDTFVPDDLSQSAWFSRDLGNLVSVSLSLADPTITDALVQAGSAPLFQDVMANADMWSRIESYVDQTTQTNTAQVTQAGQDAISQGAASPTLSVTTVDTPLLTFGRDYWLGDMVTVEVRPGDTYSDIVTSVSLTADPAQTPSVVVSPQVGYSSDPGAADPTYASRLLAMVRRIERRLNRQIG